MEATLQALGGILLTALPTFFLVILLHFYLKYIFFRPLEQVLQARYEATEGARKLAESSLAKASQKAAEYDAALRAARADMIKEQEQLRRRLQDERAGNVMAARAGAERMISEAKAQLAKEVATAQKDLAAQSESFAAQIADSILRRRVA